MRYGYADGHLSSVYNSSGKPMRFANDTTGRILSWTDRNNSQYLYQYDQFNRVVDEGGADGSLRFHFTYGDPNPTTGIKVHTETNALGHTTTYHVNEHAQITAQTDPLGNTTRFERDDYDRLLAQTDPLGRTTRYEYDGAGDLTAVTRPDGERATRTYAGELSLPEVVTYPGGATWRHTYDDAGRCTSLADPLGAVTRYGYDDSGHLAWITDALGHTIRVRCNAAGLPTEITDAIGAVTRYEHDGFGHLTAITDPLGAVTRFTWTVDGHPASRTAPDGSTETWTYDGEGNLLAHSDELGQVSTFEYTHFEILAARTGPDGSRITYSYDANMQLVAATNALGQTWSYTYDQAGRLAAERDFNQRTTTYEFDTAGQVIRLTNPLNQQIRFVYDELGRTTSVEADGQVTAYAYDLAGRLIRATNADADLVRTVDRMGNLLSETVNGRTLTHTHDVLGRRVRRTTPAGHTSTWSYDPAGRATAVATSGGRLTFAYDAAGREHRRTVDEHLTLASVWDSGHRLVEQTLQAGSPSEQSTLQRRSYQYRADGSLIGVQDQLAGQRTFDLDRAGRVTAVHAPMSSEAYTYDLAGNLTDASWPATGSTRAALGPRHYIGTQLAAAGRVQYEYDDAGRVVARQVTRLSKKPDTWQYTWDTQNRLRHVTTPDGTRWRYLYDPLGRRISKQRVAADGTTVEEQTDFTWDGPALAEQTALAPYLPGPHTLSWDHNGVEPFAQTEIIVTRTDERQQNRVDRRFFAIVTDLVGTPIELVDPASDTIAWRATPTLWGHTTWPTDSTTYTPLRFPGQYFDPETRLHYNLNRYYDPETARYATPDPLGLLPAPNPDTYVHNPHTWTDPLGLSAHGKKAGATPSRRPRLSDPLPQQLPKTHVRAYEEIRAGRGVPQTHPGTNDQKIFEGRKAHEKPWKDAKEWRVPGAKNPENARILEKELPDGRKVMAWTVDHYKTIHPFTAPHFPDDGWN